MKYGEPLATPLSVARLILGDPEKQPVVLKECHTPFILLLHGNECLYCVDLRVNIRLSWRYHASDGAKDSNIWREKVHFFNDSQICGRPVIGKDLAKNRSSLRPS